MQANRRISHLIAHVTSSSSSSSVGVGVGSPLPAYLSSLLSSSSSSSSSSASSPAQLISVIISIASAVADIKKILTEPKTINKINNQNSFGDNQLEIDVQSDKIVFDALRLNGHVYSAASEETPNFVNFKTKSEENVFSVAFDPLDGSSIVDANFSVGSIFGVWSGRSALGQTSRQQAAAALALYGPRTTLFIALPASSFLSSPTVFEVTLSSSSSSSASSSSWLVSRTNIVVSPSSRIFAPANLRAAAESPEYRRLVDYYVTNKYTLRYTGGMVPDVCHILTKGGGIFVSPVTAKSPPKLRLLFEVGPICFLFACCGGSSSSSRSGPGDEGELNPLDRVIHHTDIRTPVVIGSRKEVETAQAKLTNKQS